MTSTDKDRLLLRIKDYVLIVGAVAGLLTAGFQFYMKPLQLEARMITAEDDMKKVIGTQERDHDSVTTLKQQYTDITSRLIRIEGKLDRR